MPELYHAGGGGDAGTLFTLRFRTCPCEVVEVAASGASFRAPVSGTSRASEFILSDVNLPIDGNGPKERSPTRRPRNSDIYGSGAGTETEEKPRTVLRIKAAADGYKFRLHTCFPGDRYLGADAERITLNPAQSYLQIVFVLFRIYIEEIMLRLLDVAKRDGTDEYVRRSVIVVI